MAPKLVHKQQDHSLLVVWYAAPDKAAHSAPRTSDLHHNFAAVPGEEGEGRDRDSIHREQGTEGDKDIRGTPHWGHILEVAYSDPDIQRQKVDSLDSDFGMSCTETEETVRLRDLRQVLVHDIRVLQRENPFESFDYNRNSSYDQKYLYDCAVVDYQRNLDQFSSNSVHDPDLTAYRTQLNDPEDTTDRFPSQR